MQFQIDNPAHFGAVISALQAQILNTVQVLQSLQKQAGIVTPPPGALVPDAASVNAPAGQGAISGLVAESGGASVNDEPASVPPSAA